MKKVISEKFQNKFKEAMQIEMTAEKKPVNRPEINVSRLKTRIDHNGKAEGQSRSAAKIEMTASLNVKNMPRNQL